MNESQRDREGLQQGTLRIERDDRTSERRYEASPRDMGRAEFQTQLIHLSLRLKRGDKGTKGGQWGLEEESVRNSICSHGKDNSIAHTRYVIPKIIVQYF